MKSQLYLYKLSQDINNDYDTFDSAIVAAENEESARMIVPGNFGWEDYYKDYKNTHYAPWADRPDQVKVQLIGIADSTIEKGIVLASFNAG